MPKTTPFRKFAADVLEDPDSRGRIDQYKLAINLSLQLGQLRAGLGKTQESVAQELKTSQANVSRIEHEEDIYLSTLRNYVEALGGYLEIRAVFPDHVITLMPAAVPSPTDES